MLLILSSVEINEDVRQNLIKNFSRHIPHLTDLYASVTRELRKFREGSRSILKLDNVGVLWYNAGSTRCLDNMISFLMHIPYIIENFVKIYKPSCMHPHRYYHSAEVCKSLVMLFILFLTYVFSLYY